MKNQSKDILEIKKRNNNIKVNFNILIQLC
jgi:hypothetical protein